jgi:glycosyltransferase involved in cell wall biosynthesis
MLLSVIIPTYKRHDDLPRLLGSLNEQVISPAEIILIIGPNDEESFRIAEMWRGKLKSLKILHSEKASVIYALNIGLSETKGDIICLVDDDVWLPPDWASKIFVEFKNNDKTGGFGGRDHLQIQGQTHLSDPPLADQVGVYKWNGSLIGNHHQGVSHSPAKVDVLKGCNLSIRRSAFRSMMIDTNLISKGAETCWEIDICHQIKLAGYDLVYRNENYVLHYASPRVFNSSFIMSKYRSFAQVVMVSILSILVGSRLVPGLLWAVLLIPKFGVKTLILPWRYTKYTFKGIAQGYPLRS